MYKLLRHLWYHINSRRRMQLGGLLFLMFLVSIAEILSIGAVLPFLGVLTAPEWVFGHPVVQPLILLLEISEPRQLLLPLTLAFSVAALFSGVMRIIHLWVQTKLSHAIGADLSSSIFRRTLYQPYAVHAARNSSEVIAAIANKTTVVVYQVIWPLLVIISSLFMLVAIAGTLIVIEPVVALSAFAGFGGIYALAIALTRKRLAQYSHSISQNQVKVFKSLQEGLSGIRDVLIDGTQAAYCEYFRSADIPLRRAQANSQIIGSSPRYGIEAVGMVLIAILAYSMVGRPTAIAGTIPVLGALALGAQRLLPVLQQSYASWTSMRSGQQALVDTLDLLDQPLPEYAEASCVSPVPFQHSLTLDKLAFRYSTEMPWILRDVSLTISKGSRVGFIGSTGSGKSTLLDVIMSLLYATEGSLKIDGIPITQHNHRAWHAHIAHVPQAIFLSDTTIAENIAFGIPRDQIDHSRVREAAKKAQLAKTIEAWQHQYETPVGERGVRLSGGQRQRIGIARALYKQADIIVFDEATSALDNNTEQAVMEAIERLGEELTIIIVAHRLSTLKICTQVIELESGRIKRSGTYLEVLGSNA